MIIYHYPNKQFTQFIANYKILLFLGNNNEQYINAFINIYRDICYEYNERYVVETDNLKHNYKIYYIKARTSKHHLIIISLPFSYKNGQFIKDIFNIFEIEKIPKKINYICVTLEENNHLDEKGITIILSIFNLFEKKDKKYNIIFLCSKEKHDNIINETNKNIVFSGYINDYLSSIFNSHYFCINHKILYEKSETNKNQWNELDKAIKTIQNMIKSSTDLNLDKNKEFLFIDIFSDEKNKNYRLQKHFNSLEKTEQIILINYLILCDIPELTSSSILFLYNKILENEKKITINDNEIILSKSDNLNDTLCILSKVKFNKLKNLVGQECNLIDIDLNLIKNLFSQNLLQLDLLKNELKDISIFTKEEEFLVNLNKLDLSYNKIVNVSNLFNCKFLFLKDLNLSHNEISDINCLPQNSYFNSLQKLDLSYNRIKILNKIDIKTLNYLDLKNNEISEGFIDFLNNFCNSCFSSYGIEKLDLTRDNIYLIFKFCDAHNPLIDLKFSIEEKILNEVLKTIPLEPIKNLEILGFDNFEMLSNESLENLEILNFKIKIDDLSIFNDVKFINLKKIIFSNDEPILKGFNSLNVFSSIKLISIKIEKEENKYKCYLSCINPEINHSFIFDNLNFLKAKFLGYNQSYYLTIDIAQEILDDKNNIEFFSFNEIINSFPIFENLKARNFRL